MLSKKVPRDTERSISQFLHLPNTPFHSKYLGLPLSKESSNSRTLECVVEKVSQKVQSWKISILSQDSRTCLSRSVAAVTPVYTMSSVLFPKGICNKIDALLRDFWWGKKKTQRCSVSQGLGFHV